jgi:homospermidine synthase
MLAGGEPQGEKERQASKIKELADTLVAVGFASLDDQAQALGLSRSTTWTILKGKHKNYGLSAAVINRVLSHPGLNTHVRATIIEYVREKAAGSYGHNESQLRRFVQLLTGPTAMHVQELACAHLQTRRNALTGHTAAGR